LRFLDCLPGGLLCGGHDEVAENTLITQTPEDGRALAITLASWLPGSGAADSIVRLQK
jgi:hypothetical protein